MRWIAAAAADPEFDTWVRPEDMTHPLASDPRGCQALLDDAVDPGEERDRDAQTERRGGHA